MKDKYEIPNPDNIKIREVESMAGDCPDEWIKQWISEGYNVIHYVGNGCDEYTLMDQKTVIKL